MNLSYHDWCKQHATMFSLQGDGDPAMLHAWAMAFSAAGHSPDDLSEATQYLATTPGKVPQTRPQHIDAINARLRERKLYRMRHNDESVTYRDTHRLCHHGTGFVIVPNPKAIHDGSWQAPYYTCAVICDCPAGNRRLESQAKREHKQMTFRQYELKVPNWEQMVAIRDAARSEMAKARRLADQGESDWIARRTRLSAKDIAEASRAKSFEEHDDE